MSMDAPDNLDVLLAQILHGDTSAADKHKVLDDDDRAFVERIMDSVTTGSKGIFVVLHPNNIMQYILLNTNRAGSLALLATVMQRQVEALEKGLPED
jgi:hypothetical protein